MGEVIYMLFGEWNVGEAAGALAAHCLRTNLKPVEVWHDAKKLEEFQRKLTSQGVEIRWPKTRPP